MDIEYRDDISLEMLQNFSRDQSQPLLPQFVKSINGVPLDECDSETRMAANFEVLAFLVPKMEALGTSLNNNMSSDGDS